ncbi:facilitated trehalose transporter Tret1-like isoform X2 [Epargyreus clarus]
MTLGFPTILIPAVREPAEEEMKLEQSEISWIGSINLIVVPLGCAMSGVVTTPLGRRRAMQLVNVPFFVAWLILHFATSSAHLYAALSLTGLAGGLLEAPVLTYVAEVTQPHLRGSLTATSSMCIILGVFTQFLFGLLLPWRSVALLNISFTILAVVALCFIPESPHWLVSRKRHEEARKSLQWLRGWTGAKAVEDELRDIQALFKKGNGISENEEETLAEKLSHYKERSFLLPFGLVCYAFFVGHFSGMTTLQTYAVSIFQMLQAPLDKYYATLVLGVLQLAGAGGCVLLVARAGKRPLALASTAGAALCCALLAGYDAYVRFYGLPKDEEIEKVTANTTAAPAQAAVADNPYSWIPTSLLMLLAFITHTGIRLLPWILIGEVFSANTRSGAAGLASAVGYIFGFLTNKMYLSMVSSLAIWGTYGFYAIVCFTGCIAFYFILPETEGKQLIDIENHFAGIKRLDNKVYRSKKRRVDVARLRDLKGVTNTTFEGDNPHEGRVSFIDITRFELNADERPSQRQSRTYC